MSVIMLNVVAPPKYLALFLIFMGLELSQNGLAKMYFTYRLVSLLSIDIYFYSSVDIYANIPDLQLQSYEKIAMVNETRGEFVEHLSRT